MSAKAPLLAAVRDELKSVITGVANRVYVVVRDAQGNQLLPKEAALPFLTVADGGTTFTPQAGKLADGSYDVIVRAHVAALRDAEAPVIGHAGSGEQGAAQLQDAIVAALYHTTLAGRLAGVDEALPVSLGPVDFLADEGFFAVIGDVTMRYTILEDGA